MKGLGGCAILAQAHSMDALKDRSNLLTQTGGKDHSLGDRTGAVWVTGRGSLGDMAGQFG